MHGDWKEEKDYLYLLYASLMIRYKLQTSHLSCKRPGEAVTNNFFLNIIAY